MRSLYKDHELPTLIQLEMDPMLILDDRFDNVGFGGVVGANRHVYPYQHFHFETLPKIDKFGESYGFSPGHNLNYGTRAMGDAGDELSGSVAKAKYR